MRIRLTPKNLWKLSNRQSSCSWPVILSEAYTAVQDIITLLAKEGLTKIPIVVGGIIPEEDKQNY